ncbi:photosystem I reaction center subunit XI [Pseudanabaena sp. BC1403]|uniref:photosystem I reaction center subunit XI n=1 Tax=Pseudanabaena sp. BC1403 TaxID=2043171 RepID=UPI000CD90E80|nr:photosystem I reaction center subunit XI [Pseudanabaena sp. BC1403]
MTDFVKPFKNDPQLGNLSTPISDSAIVKAFIGNLPAYRAGLSPSRRGLEIGMAHGYFIYGPFALLGPLRNTELASLAGLLATIASVVLLTVGLSLYGQTVTKLQSSSALEAPAELGTSAGWSEFSSSFLLGGAGGAAFAYFLNYLEPMQKFLGLLWN